VISDKLPIGLVPLSGRTTLLRMVKNIPSFLPPGASLPASGAFVPSTRDKSSAQESGWLTAGVSVWDESQTSVAQAVAFMPVPSDAYVPFRADLACIHAIGVPQPGQTFAVCHTPRPVADGAGAWGHCDLFGCDNPCALPRPAFKNLLDELAQCFHRAA
jgi:hypothetical protein